MNTILNSDRLFLAAMGTETNRVWAIVLGVLLAFVTIGLLVASWTRWGQTKSLTKCIALAFLAHVWLLMYAYGTRITTPGVGGGTGGGVRQMVDASTVIEFIHSMDNDSANEHDAFDNIDTSEATPMESVAPTSSESTFKQMAAPELLAATERPSDPVASDESQALNEADALPVVDDLSISKELLTAATIAQSMDSNESESSQANQATQERAVDDVSRTAVTETAPALNDVVVPKVAPVVTAQSIAASSQRMVRKIDHQPMPDAYAMRLSPNRTQYAMQGGGDENTEASVQNALRWLASAQSPDGSWNAAAYGAGRGSMANRLSPDGEERMNAGERANTGMTGLALLAFLGAGNTHLEGEHARTVARGLSYLLQQQFPSGDMSGRDQIGRDPSVRFARMYCHGMASLALAEAYGMTGDPALLGAVQAASRYTTGAMNPRTGGWRYEFPTDDPGDMSQFGWQAMVLHSAHRSGAIELPVSTRSLMQQFLDSVSAGRSGGLAVYRRLPGRRTSIDERPSPAMTAESLASRLLLGMPVSTQAASEGQQLLLRNLPGRSEENLYYWYYATISMYQLRSSDERSSSINSSNEPDAWSTWNESLKRQLCSSQVTSGEIAGSWNPTCVWGAYGGRIYSTSLACLSLEVYYRYLPMYKQ